MRLHVSQTIFLFLAAVIGGTLNAVAGGGTFVSFPALLAAGCRRCKPTPAIQLPHGLD